ncbi:uncharacterized protein LOC131951632 [Physella acuta]|uniref:uncharacterized protein LOC131951632 n=1 Tax=Physella acuta TaxID=109671 RepID=UPI0027DD2AEF|nr:uncharacterized protein LOC131951632 [Physella acuta]
MLDVMGNGLWITLGPAHHFLVLILVMLVPCECTTESMFRITPPPYYVVFSGDLDFSYTIPGNVSLPHAFIRLEYQGKISDDPLIITTLGLRLGKKSETLKVACGVIEFAGNYTLKMYTRVRGEVLVSANLEVRWPEVAMSLPDAHEAQTLGVELRIISKANCTSLLQRNHWLLQLYFQRNDIGGSLLVLSEAELVSTSNFTDVNKLYSTSVFGCHLFDLDGSYQAVLVSSQVGSPVIAVSNVMVVSWSMAYMLTSTSQSVFPCENSVHLLYTHPPCSGTDKIRLYRFKQILDSSIASPLERIYITELPAQPDLVRMSFDCRLFNQSSTGFCFIYVSVTRHKVVTEQKQLCLPAFKHSVFPTDGGWSMWTSWTACSVTCGTGRKSRFRICNEPTPKHGGRFCSGDPVEWRPCELHCPEAIPRTPLHSPNLDPNCACGCKKREVQGQIIGTGRCHGSSIWTLEAATGQVIVLEFDYFSLNLTLQWVKVRDGATDSDTLLFSSASSAYPVEITSSGPSMRVELMTNYTSMSTVATFSKNATLPIHAHGFIAHYQVRAVAASSTARVLYQHQQETMMGSLITLVGIAVCGLVIIAAIIFVLVQRTLLKRPVKYSMTTSTDSPLRPDSSQQQDSSGVSNSSPGKVVHVDQSIPLTKANNPSRGNGRSSAASSASSRKCKSSPTARDTLISAYGIEIVDTDLLDGVSPLRKQSLHSTIARLSPGSPITKLDMLNKKRNGKKGKGVSTNLEVTREVTGSSGSQHSASTTKAEVSWPQGSFINHPVKADKSNKRSAPRPPSEEIPLLDSMTSSLESPSHFHNMVKSDSTESATTSFMHPKPARRPTSLTNCYSNDTLKKSNTKQLSLTPTSDAAEISVTDLTPKPVQYTTRDDPQTLEQQTFTAPPPPLVLPQLSSKRRRPVRSSPSQHSLASNKSANNNCANNNSANTNSVNNKAKRSAFEERQSLLPKPDGQSPKLERRDTPLIAVTKADSNRELSSPGKASKTSSKNISSPTRSITTPSEIDGLELEYDDFIEDDPLSYFDYEQTQKLAFRGVEKIGKTPVEEEDEDEV